VVFIEKLMPWGPVFFGLFIFAPMWAAVMAAAELNIRAGTPNIFFILPIGFVWGIVAKSRGRWL
jgi:hypothetical protein